MPSPAEDSEETRRLLDQAQAGDARAVGLLFDRHRAYLVRLAELRLDAQVQGRVDPSDVVQEAQMEAHRRLADYLRRPPLPFRLWLRQIAYDRLLMLHRRHARAEQRAVGREAFLSEQSSLLLAGGLFAGGPTASEKAVREELAERVRRALAALPAGEREVLVLRNLEGLTNLEVAQLLEVDQATASRRYGRAVLRLREVLVRGGWKGSES